MRGVYGVFYTKYNKSGHNESDPTCYAHGDMVSLLIHWTFHENPIQAWAAKSCDPDDAMDSDGLMSSTKKSLQYRHRKKTFCRTQDVVSFMQLAALQLGTDERSRDHA